MNSLWWQVKSISVSSFIIRKICVLCSVLDFKSLLTSAYSVLDKKYFFINFGSLVNSQSVYSYICSVPRILANIVNIWCGHIILFFKRRFMFSGFQCFVILPVSRYMTILCTASIWRHVDWTLFLSDSHVDRTKVQAESFLLLLWIWAAYPCFRTMQTSIVLENIKIRELKRMKSTCQCQGRDNFLYQEGYASSLYAS